VGSSPTGLIWIIESYYLEKEKQVYVNGKPAVFQTVFVGSSPTTCKIKGLVT
jgi:hypothetical protein